MPVVIAAAAVVSGKAAYDDWQQRYAERGENLQVLYSTRAELTKLLPLYKKARGSEKMLMGEYLEDIALRFALAEERIGCMDEWLCSPQDLQKGLRLVFLPIITLGLGYELASRSNMAARRLIHKLR